MNGRYFLDTNVFVYTFDSTARKKREVARDMVNAALRDNQGLISWQVVQEFFNAATRKFPTPMSLDECRRYLDQVLSPLCEVFPSMDLCRKALEIHTETQFAFYDSLIVAAAIESGCKTLFTEDMQEGRLISGLTIRNPFKAI